MDEFRMLDDNLKLQKRIVIFWLNITSVIFLCFPDAGYVATPIIMIYSALVILDEAKKLPQG